MPPVPCVFLNLQAAYNSQWLNPHGSSGSLLKPEVGEEAVEALPPNIAALIPAPPPPAQYICNPAHLFVRATLLSASKPLVFDQNYIADFDHYEYAIDNTGRSYLILFVNVDNT